MIYKLKYRKYPVYNKMLKIEKVKIKLCPKKFKIYHKMLKLKSKRIWNYKRKYQMLRVN